MIILGFSDFCVVFEYSTQTSHVNISYALGFYEEQYGEFLDKYHAFLDVNGAGVSEVFGLQGVILKKLGEQDFVQWYFSERNLQILHKKYGKIRAIYFAKTGEKLMVF